MLYHGIRFALGYVSKDLKLKLLSLALGIKSIKLFKCSDSQFNLSIWSRKALSCIITNCARRVSAIRTKVNVKSELKITFLGHLIWEMCVIQSVSFPLLLDIWKVREGRAEFFSWKRDAPSNECCCTSGVRAFVAWYPRSFVISSFGWRVQYCNWNW